MTIRRSFEIPASVSRRSFLADAALGIGSVALTHLLAQDGALAAGSAQASTAGHDLTPRTGHLPARATSVIMLLQNGGPSQMDLFDPKPELTRLNGQSHPGEIIAFQPGSVDKKIMASPFQFQRTAHAAWNSRNCCPASETWRTTFVSSARCSPTTTTIPRGCGV
ncbi:MAG: DUF1501 domain-containing protein [Planctomycetaceae bacterium]